MSDHQHDAGGFFGSWKSIVASGAPKQRRRKQITPSCRLIHRRRPPPAQPETNRDSRQNKTCRSIAGQAWTTPLSCFQKSPRTARCGATPFATSASTMNRIQVLLARVLVTACTLWMLLYCLWGGTSAGKTFFSSFLMEDKAGTPVAALTLPILVAGLVAILSSAAAARVRDKYGDKISSLDAQVRRIHIGISMLYSREYDPVVILTLHSGAFGLLRFPFPFWPCVPFIENCKKTCPPPRPT